MLCMNDSVLKTICFLLEEKRVFIVRGDCSGILAKAAGVSRRELEKIVLDLTGMEISFVVDLYRVQHARELLLAGVDYQSVWALSGFASPGALDRAFECIVG